MNKYVCVVDINVTSYMSWKYGPEDGTVQTFKAGDQ